MIPLFKVFMNPGVVRPLARTLASGYVGQGEKVDKFERALAGYVANTLVLTTNSGTSALHLALRVAGVGPGTEVISTPMTCVATNMPILERGARIRWADVDPASGLVDPTAVRRLFTSRTRAVVCVDWSGMPCDLDPLVELCEKRGAVLIEDAAHAFGAVYKKHEVGAHAHFTCFSFQAIKHLTTGDGGAVAFKRREDYERARLLRWYGYDRTKPDAQGSHFGTLVPEYGYKFHMNDIAATIGLAQLPHVAGNLERHRHVASYYRFHMNDAGLKSVRPARTFKDRWSAEWIFTVLADDADGFIKHMTDCGVTASRVHRRNDDHPCFASFYERRLPGVDEFAAREVAIPCGWWVDDEAMRYVMRAVDEYEEKRSRHGL